jgi:uncharacterized protein (TIGR02145 family)
VSDSAAFNTIPVEFGLSVRCLQDIPDSPPIVNTLLPIEVLSTTAKLAVQTIYNGSLEPYTMGIYIGESPNPSVTGSLISFGTSGIGVFEYLVSDLFPNQNYYYVAYAINENGTSYGTEQSFTTLNIQPGGGVTDADENNYPTVIIGNLEWMAQNLKVTQYDNFEPLDRFDIAVDWVNATNGAYCIHPLVAGISSESEMVDAYGIHYNGYSLSNVNGLCPDGWRVPSFEDWDYMIEYLGGGSKAGGHLKSIAVQSADPHPHWFPPNEGATNSSGFNAIPAGVRNNFGNFLGITYGGYYWATGGNFIILSFENDDVGFNSGEPANSGMSVRCVKEAP